MTVDRVLGQVARLSAALAAERGKRQLARALDPADLLAVAETGFHRLLVPTEYGGLWQSVARSTRPVARALALVGGADSSLGLVLSMEPYALFVTGWLADPDLSLVDAGWLAQRERMLTALAEHGGAWGLLFADSGPAATTSAGPGPDGSYRLTGQKGWGSGWGGTAYMLVTAVAEGEDCSDLFILDTAGAMAEGTATIVRAWDGHGVASSNSHAVGLAGARAERVSWPGRQDLIKAMRANPLTAARIAPTVGIVRAATAAAGAQLGAASPGPYEAAEWARGQAEAWLVDQAFEGAIRAAEESPTALAFDTTAQLAKLAVAERAESVLSLLGHALGAAAYLGSSPFGWWLHDVRALNHLMPPTSRLVRALTEARPR
jgi:alkylation response protein AidB-like acyl-CoA dehydrogenase